MFTHKHGAVALVAAFLLAVGLASPLTTHTAAAAAHAAGTNIVAGVREDSPVAATPGASMTDSAAPVAIADETEPQPKKSGNGFVRAITAPFRALAKIFGGGKKNKTETARTKTAVKVAGDVATKQSAPSIDAAATTNTRDAEKKRETASKKTERAAVAVAEPSPVKRETAARPVSAVGNGARETARQSSPQPFTPVIAGVPLDSLSQGRALLSGGHLNEAIAQLSIAASVGPDLIEANNLLGQTYDRLGWHTLAQECYERALQAAPKDPRTLANLGYSFYLADKYAPALKRLKQAARIAPFDARITANIAQVHFRLGQYDEAFKNFASITNAFEARVTLARLFEGTARPAQAIRQYELALKLQPNAPNVLENLAALYEQTGRSREAEATRRTLRNPPNKQKSVTGGG